MERQEDREVEEWSPQHGKTTGGKREVGAEGGTAKERGHLKNKKMRGGRDHKMLSV